MQRQRKIIKNEEKRSGVAKNKTLESGLISG